MSKLRDIANTLESVAEMGFKDLEEIEEQHGKNPWELATCFRHMLVMSINAHRNVAKELHRREDEIEGAINNLKSGRLG